MAVRLGRLERELQVARQESKSGPLSKQPTTAPRFLQAEWKCSCGWTNFLTRENCRKCGLRWHNSFALIPARPIQHVAGTRSIGGGDQKGESARGQNKDAIKGAEQALASAKAAGLSEVVISQLEEEVKAKKAEAAASKPLPLRLQTATTKVSQATAYRKKMQLQAEQARTALQKAEKALQDAAQAEEQLQEEWKQISAQVASVAEENSAPKRGVAEEALHA